MGVPSFSSNGSATNGPASIADDDGNDENDENDILVGNNDTQSDDNPNEDVRRSPSDR